MKIFMQNGSNADSLLKGIGVFSSALLFASSVVYLYSPVIKTSAANESSTLDYKINITEVMSLVLDRNNLNLVADLNSFTSGTVNAIAYTNSQYGYTLALEDNDNDSSLVHTDSGINASFPSTFSDSVTSSTMETNTWGFSINSTDYYKIPTNGHPVAIKRTHTFMTEDSETTPVRFGAQVGNIASGDYTDELLFTMYVNGQDGKPTNPSDPDNPPDDPDDIGGGGSDDADFFSITSMQDMTSTICATANTPASGANNIDWDGSHADDDSYVPRTQLTDSRDGKTYLVSKQADGNCWMSQNLALDLVAGSAVISSNNDGTTGSFIPEYTTMTETGTTWAHGENAARSYRPPASASYVPQGGPNVAGSASGEGREYDWEKVGNYYNWYAATAGTGTYELYSAGGYSDAVNATASICPKGWRLPTVMGDQSFVTLYVSSGVTLMSTPLNFIRPGQYLGLTGEMLFPGSSGVYWTSSAGYPSSGNSKPFDNAYALSVTTRANTTYQNFKIQLSSVRCVAI